MNTIVIIVGQHRGGNSVGNSYLRIAKSSVVAMAKRIKATYMHVSRNVGSGTYKHRLPAVGNGRYGPALLKAIDALRLRQLCGNKQCCQRKNF